MTFKMPDTIPPPYKVEPNDEFEELIMSMALDRCSREHPHHMNRTGHPCDTHQRLARANLELAYEKQAEDRASEAVETDNG